ncbi:hypothetical protein F5B19DRAFT_113746 [Rostrohypoxylon terebratum]|nr:hypothetical protein F5B19DRAFT_113746 [Rostrohypoxylon terebratum]
MLLRQLQRPSPRSVVALAAWQPILTATAPLHGSSRRLESKSSSSSSPTPPSSEDSKPKPDKDDKKPADKPSSTSTAQTLFEKLFPYETKRARQSTNPWSSRLFTDPPLTPPPTFEFDPDLVTAWIPADSPGAIPLRAESMLILNAASPSLCETDFLRLGPQGYHVEGWVGGISRVIQARDPDTLRPLGRYFILFDSPEAALAYQDEADRLWSLARQHAHSSAPGKRWNKAPVPPGLWKDEKGRDVATRIKGFTLAPSSLVCKLRVSNAANLEKIVDLDIGGTTFLDLLASRTGSRHLVLVTVDGGRIPVGMLRRAIEEDGMERNLPWRVTDLENGILPFGKSVLKMADRKALEEAAEEAGLGENDIIDDKMFRRYPRFIVPFTDSAEAHRFVRGWHRRQLKIRMNIQGEDQKEISWDETRILNTSVLR